MPHCHNNRFNQTMFSIKNIFLIFFLISLTNCQSKGYLLESNVAEGWASNSINAVIFRKNSLTSNSKYQFISFYDKNGYVMIGKRNLHTTKWILKQTPFKGDISDAHKSISIQLDKDNFIHLAWGMHNQHLNYAKSLSPNSLEFEKITQMTGLNEDKITYPEFYKGKNKLYFIYRDGGSGNGNLVINSYENKKWTQIQSNLIDGQNKRNAYWQFCIDKNDYLYVSWVWRESPDVASNHDLCFAMSKDGGRTWMNSKNKNYNLPITIQTAEKIVTIPQNSELINQTSMSVDDNHQPYICSYWREQNDSIPQYHIVYLNNDQWKTSNLSFRKTAFSLSGMGTKKIPISRPQIITWGKNNIGVIYRDQENNNLASLVYTKNIQQNQWYFKNLSKEPLGMWEPSYDTELWQSKSILNLYSQKVDQIDAEGISTSQETEVKIIQWKPSKNE